MQANNKNRTSPTSSNMKKRIGLNHTAAADVGVIQRIVATAPLIILPWVMSLPGLSCRWDNRRSVSSFLVWSLAPVMLENIVLLATAHRIATKTSNNNRTVAMLSLSVFFFFVCLFGSADYAFQKKTGLVPDRFIVRSFPARWRDDLGDEVDTDLKGVIWTIVSVVYAYATGALVYALLIKGFGKAKATKQNPLLCSNILYIAAIACLLVIYTLGGWTPVTNITLCWMGFPFMIAMEWTPAWLLGTPTIGYSNHDGSNNVRRPGLNASRLSPNIILIVTDSLSGAIMDSPKGREKMPFFYEKMASMNNMYNFKYARTMTGSTTTALPAILTGLNPFTEDCRSLSLGTSLAAELKPKGYESVMFSSWKIMRQKNTPFQYLASHLLSQFDKVYDPVSTDTPIVHGSAMDDRTNLANFAKWIKERQSSGNDNSSQPFFAILYWFNIHSPWNIEKERLRGASGGVRYIESLRLIDDAYKHVFDTVQSVNLGRNTMIVGTGDHGDRPGLRRMKHPNDFRILHVPLWMRIPRKIVSRNEMQLLRKRAQNETVSILDIMPTMRHILGLGKYTKEEVNECITGIDLLDEDEDAVTTPSRDDDDDRFQVGWSGHPQEIYAQASGILSIAKRDRALIIYVDNLSQSVQVEFPIDRGVLDNDNNDRTDHNYHRVSLMDEYAKESIKSLDELTVDDRASWAKILKDYNLTRIIEEKIPSFRSLLLQE